MPAAHRHVGYDETVHVLAGAGEFTLDGRRVTLGAGETIFVPRGTPHAFSNIGAETLRLLAIVTPGLLGPDYFRAAAEILNSSGPPDLARLGTLMHQHGMTLA